MADHPMLFSAPMVRALRAGTKTQTRRTIKSARVFATPERPAWTLRGEDLDRAMQGADRFRRMDGDGWFWEADAFEWQAPSTRTGWLAHIGHAPGVRLWVREAWKPHSSFSDMRPRDMPKSRIFYRADDTYAPSNTPWIPSIHMPRWASRLTLIVTDVRVQRLQEISEADAIAEGSREPSLAPIIGACWSERDAYAKLWTAINGPGSWEANPWVTATSFDVIHQNIDEVGSGRT
ncbi:MAG TPA: hypothetical protein VNX29_01865 [Kaistia sp.]|nr:hypothetical protein [Kaistia sp.]